MSFQGIGIDFVGLIYVPFFHYFMVLYSATIVIKNGKYTVPFFEQNMVYILVHFRAWAIYKSHDIAF